MLDHLPERPKIKPAVFKPMLAATCEDMAALRYPVLASPKLDGIRCLILDGVTVSRNLKPIPNHFVQDMLKGCPEGWDGELIVGEPNGAGVFERTQSGVMSVSGTPKFTFFVFDNCKDSFGFDARHSTVEAVWSKAGHSTHVPHWWDRTCPLPHQHIADHAALMAYEQKAVEKGYEGIMVRDPHGAYKFGRSTVREGGLLKVKRWKDAEAVVVGMVELMHNGNEATTDALGRTKRSASKEGKTGKGVLGALVCELPGGVQFELGTGFSSAQRADLWRGSANVIGQTVTFKYQELSKDGVPRFPVWKAFRMEGA